MIGQILPNNNERYYNNFSPTFREVNTPHDDSCFVSGEANKLEGVPFSYENLMYNHDENLFLIEVFQISVGATSHYVASPLQFSSAYPRNRLVVYCFIFLGLIIFLPLCLIYSSIRSRRAPRPAGAGPSTPLQRPRARSRRAYGTALGPLI
jgi:hypothetical protein